MSTRNLWARKKKKKKNSNIHKTFIEWKFREWGLSCPHTPARAMPETHPEGRLDPLLRRPSHRGLSGSQWRSPWLPHLREPRSLCWPRQTLQSSQTYAVAAFVISSTQHVRTRVPGPPSTAVSADMGPGWGWLPGGGRELHPTNAAWADLPHWIQMLQDHKRTLWNPDQLGTQCSPEPSIRSKLRALHHSQALPCHGARSIFSRDFHTMWLLIEGGMWNIQWGYFCFSNTDTSDIRGQTWSVPAEKEKSA